MVLPNALAVHTFVPAVEAVDVNVTATVPVVGSMLFSLPPLRVVVITPLLTVGTDHVRIVGPGSVAITLSDPPVMVSPAGTAIVTQSISSLPVLVLVTVSVYCEATPVWLEDGEMLAVKRRASVKVVV